MAFILTALTLTQLFARQAQLHADHERILAARNSCAVFSFDWDLHNAALTGTMQDIADVTCEISSRIADMLEAEAGQPPAPLETDVPMVCTACRGPVVSVPALSKWAHLDWNDISNCQAMTVMAMVAEGNESVPRQ